LTPSAPEAAVAEAAVVEELAVVEKRDFQVAVVEEADFPEKAQRAEADFRLPEDKVVREAGILHPNAAVASKAASSTAKVLRTSKREAVTSRTARVL
jgi:hypothetical protein